MFFRVVQQDCSVSGKGFSVLSIFCFSPNVFSKFRFPSRPSFLLGMQISDTVQWSQRAPVAEISVRTLKLHFHGFSTHSSHSAAVGTKG
jgi:hypothetical protein